MNTVYIVRAPIHGYSGMGYESKSYLDFEYTDEKQARKQLRRCNKAYELEQLQDGAVYNIPGKRYWTDRESAFWRVMTDNVSYSFRGPSQLIKRTVQDTAMA